MYILLKPNNFNDDPIELIENNKYSIIGLPQIIIYKSLEGLISELEYSFNWEITVKSLTPFDSDNSYVKGFVLNLSDNSVFIAYRVSNILE